MGREGIIVSHSYFVGLGESSEVQEVKELVR